jgi:putative ABC transport system substrate-binding protein
MLCTFHRWFITLLVVVAPLLPADAWAEKRIGVLLFSEEARYHESLKGMLDQLAKAGYVPPKVTFVKGNAGGSKAKAAELVRGYVADNLSLMLTLGTNATIAAATEIKGVPIVFSMVYDPVEARVAKDWKSSGTNVTGASPWVSMSALVALLKEVRPVKRLAVLYTPGEKNSEAQLKEVQALQNQAKIKVLPVIVAKKEDVSLLLPEVMYSVDAVYFTGSSVIGSTVPPIVALANKAKVITITHLEDLVKEGVMFGVCADPYRLGVMAGKKAVAILKGARPSSIPIEYLSRPDVVMNSKSVHEAQVQIPASVLAQVAKTFK